MSNSTESSLSVGAQALLKRLARSPIPVVYGRGGWRPTSLPKPAKKADLDAVIKAGLAKIDSKVGLTLVVPDESV
ncbi:hypothetical protein [Burkholderia ubonensis]|uniref:hypothetical protein n=1 Tax=Burkholderia ubonensis TaxID=101571 RepID=UPI000A7723A8|nr:hypothetical protein [Burkholderia ubonensis]